MNLPLRYFQIVLFLLAAVPCAIPYRYQPNPVFPSELAAFVLAALLALGGAFVPGNRHKRVQLPAASLPWFALAAVLALQCWLLPTPYLSERTVPILYLLCAAFSAWSLLRAKESFGAERLMQGFAWGLLAGALVNSGIGLSQLIDLFQNGWRLIYGNIGQKNMYGHYLAWGLAATVWLASERKLPTSAFWLVSIWLTLSMAWSSSRSVFLYALAWLPMAGFVIWRGREQTRRLGWFLAAAAVLILAMQFVAPIINNLLQSLLHASNDAPTGVDRLASNGSRRLVEWTKAWLVFKSHPLLGVGWGAFAVNSVILQSLPEFAKVQESVLFTHAHNSVLNLMAETGILGAGAVTGGILWMYGGLLRRWRDPLVLAATAMVTVSVLHSLVEYPLWYFHLFGPFALMLVFMREGGVGLPFSNRKSGFGFAVCSGSLLAVAALGAVLYLKIYPILEPAKDGKANAASIRILEKLRHHPLLDFYGDFALSNYIIVDGHDMPWKLGILRRLNSLRPYPGQMTDQAVMEALNGNMDRAHELVRQAAYAYPESFDYFYSTLSRFPEPRVQALLADVEEARLFFGAKRPDEQHE